MPSSTTRSEPGTSGSHRLTPRTIARLSNPMITVGRSTSPSSFTNDDRERQTHDKALQNRLEDEGGDEAEAHESRQQSRAENEMEDGHPQWRVCAGEPGVPSKWCMRRPARLFRDTTRPSTRCC